MSFFSWLKNLFCKNVENVEEDTVQNEDLHTAVIQSIIESITDVDDVVWEDTKNEDEEDVLNFLKNLDWENLTESDIEYMMKFDLTAFNEHVKWFNISNFINLPDNFCIRYREQIIWSEYDKRYLSRSVRDLLKSEGRI